jgi:hypothetical protein
MTIDTGRCVFDCMTVVCGFCHAGRRSVRYGVIDYERVCEPLSPKGDSLMLRRS